MEGVLVDTLAPLQSIHFASFERRNEDTLSKYRPCTPHRWTLCVAWSAWYVQSTLGVV